MDQFISIIQPQAVHINNIIINQGKALSNKSKERFSVKIPELKDRITMEFELLEQSAYNFLVFHTVTQIKEIKSINLFFSDDSLYWFRIPISSMNIVDDALNLSFPLIRSKYLQAVILIERKISDVLSGYLTKSCSTLFKSSSDKDRLWVPENLVDGRENYGWATSSKSSDEREHVTIDLKNSYYITQVSMRSAKDENPNFPDNFVIQLSSDGQQWHSVIEESNFSAASLSWYQWPLMPFQARYAKILIFKSKDYKNRSYKILDVDIHCIPENEITSSLRKGFDSNLGASELVPGLVRFSEYNGNYPLRAVQASDPRLREATSEYPGIVQLARNGSARKGFAIQGDDSRLREATTEYSGIVQLAKDRGNSPGIAVQSNDSRIMPSTEERAGIVRLSKDKEVSPGTVVQSNDSRLRTSTTSYPGIVQLAKDGSSMGNYALQSNDSRLRYASTTWPGIMQFASHGKTSKNKALQSDDPRLLEGTEEVKGRVRFAKDRGKEPFTAIQSNDSRLTSATEEKDGIVRLAKPGEKKSNLVTQANDPRLEDPRPPLPHDHDYATKSHAFNEHTGCLNLEINSEVKEAFAYNITGLNNFPLSVKNKSGASAAFQGGIVVEGDKHSALNSFSKSNIGIKSKSKNKYAGMFISEKSFGLYLPSQIDELLGSGKSLLAEGDSIFRGNFAFQNGISIAVSWPSFSDQSFAEGDLLTIQDDSKVHKLKSNHQCFLGVYTKKPSFCLSRSESEAENSIHIVIFGIINIRIKGQIQSGNWVGYLDDEPGVGRKISQVQKQHSFAIAMESSQKESEKLIPCLIRR